MNSARPSMHIVMMAAENDALPGFKVGGIGDVLRDLPPALAALGSTVTVVTPSYGLRDELPSARHMNTVNVAFRGTAEPVEILEARPDNAAPGVRNLVLDHAAFSACGRGKVYCDDPPEQPFASDASKFASVRAALGLEKLTTTSSTPLKVASLSRSTRPAVIA